MRLLSQGGAQADCSLLGAFTHQYSSDGSNVLQTCGDAVAALVTVQKRDIKKSYFKAQMNTNVVLAAS
jgi:hypothetical protein